LQETNPTANGHDMLPSPSVLEISCSDLQSLRDSGTTLRLVDCREDDEWQFNRIEGAELVPLSRFMELAGKRFASQEEEIVIYCHHGMRSGQAAHFLRQKGLKNVWSLAGGIDAWALEVDPAVRRY
jgi:adenylyltransferase/sulfurtransferase